MALSSEAGILIDYCNFRIPGGLNKFMELLEAHIEEVGLGQIEKLGNVNAEVIFVVILLVNVAKLFVIELKIVELIDQLFFFIRVA